MDLIRSCEVQWVSSKPGISTDARRRWSWSCRQGRGAEHQHPHRNRVVLLSEVYGRQVKQLLARTPNVQFKSRFRTGLDEQRNPVTGLCHLLCFSPMALLLQKISSSLAEMQEDYTNPTQTIRNANTAFAGNFQEKKNTSRFAKILWSVYLQTDSLPLQGSLQGSQQDNVFRWHTPENLVFFQT